jgi:hypothetical protein
VWTGNAIQFHVGPDRMSITSQASPLEFESSVVLGPFRNISERCLSVDVYLHATIAVDNTLAFSGGESHESGTTTFSGRFSSPTSASGEFATTFDFGACRGQRSGAWTAVAR